MAKQSQYNDTNASIKVGIATCTPTLMITLIVKSYIAAININSGKNKKKTIGIKYTHHIDNDNHNHNTKYNIKTIAKYL